jgi:hypothetical protein
MRLRQFTLNFFTDDFKYNVFMIDFYSSQLTLLLFWAWDQLRSTNAEAVHTRTELEKEQFLIEKYNKLMCNNVNSFTILSMCLTVEE